MLAEPHNNRAGKQIEVVEISRVRQPIEGELPEADGRHSKIDKRVLTNSDWLLLCIIDPHGFIAL